MEQLLEQLKAEAVKWRWVLSDQPNDQYALGKTHGLEFAVHELEKVIGQQKVLNA